MTAQERPWTLGAAEVVPVSYRSDEWHEIRRQGVAASEIAAVLGLSPWTSRFDLWWAKRTGEDSQPDNPDMRRGRRLESLVLEDFGIAHPEFTVTPGLTLRSAERPWQYATPDSIAYDGGGGTDPLAVVEAKTAGSRAEWGEPGTDQIPVHYRTQVQWQMDVLGVTTAYVPVWFGTTYAEYVVEYDQADVYLMRIAAGDFLLDLEQDVVPEIDAHTATTRRLKHLHPDVTEGEVEVPGVVVAQYRAARRLRDAAEARMRLAENRLRHAIGDYQLGVVDGVKAVRRSVYDVPEKTITRKAFTANKITVVKEPTA